MRVQLYTGLSTADMDSHDIEHLGAYKNLPALLRYRGGFSIVSEPLRPSHVGDGNELTPNNIVGNILSKFGKWEVVASRTVDGSVETAVVFMLHESSKATSSAAELVILAKLAAKYTKDIGSKVGSDASLAEIIVLASSAVAKKPNLLQKIRDINKSLHSADHTTAGCKIFMFSYDRFSVIVPEHPLVYKHERISIEEAAKLLPQISCLAMDRSSKPPKLIHDEFKSYAARKLPLLITSTDNAAIWFGIKPGDFVKVHRPSITAGEFVPIVRYAV